MRTRILRLTAFLLTIILLTLPTVCAAETVDYVFPDDWSHDALVFAVENGIFIGNQNHDLRPESYITRAEMAAVMVRLLGATETGDLSSFLDVDAGAWYYNELSAAYASGIFNGVSETSMQPTAQITREQAATVICRAFGIVSDDRTAYQSFSDGEAATDFACDAISAMKTMGIIHGYVDGSFRPLAYITRAEVAQIIYHTFDCITDAPEELPESGWALYRGTEPLPEVLSFDGTLILGQSAPAEFTAAQWDISESLVVRTGGETNADLHGLHTKRLISAPLGGSVASEVGEVYLWGGGAAYSGDAEQLTVLGGSHTYQGDSGSLSLRDGALIHNGNTGNTELEQGSALTLNGGADGILVNGSDVHLTVNGQVNSVTVNGERAVVDGSGRAANIVVCAEVRNITLACDNLRDVWYENYQKEHDSALSTVKTTYIPCTVRSTTTLYQNRNLTGYIRELPAGTVVYNEYHPTGNVLYVSLSDGTFGWVPRWTCDIHVDTVTTDGTLDYSKATKEGFVDLNGYDSATDYLVWVSRYTQKVMVFQGKKGDWTLIRTFHCSTGSNNTPTPQGIFTIYSRTSRWYFDEYYVNNVSIFNGGHAFHTILFNYNGSIRDGRTGTPLSKGCVRMLPDDCKYIYNLPSGTRVVIY